MCMHKIGLLHVAIWCVKFSINGATAQHPMPLCSLGDTPVCTHTCTCTCTCTCTQTKGDTALCFILVCISENDVFLILLEDSSWLLFLYSDWKELKHSIYVSPVECGLSAGSCILNLKFWRHPYNGVLLQAVYFTYWTYRKPQAFVHSQSDSNFQCTGFKINDWYNIPRSEFFFLHQQHDSHEAEIQCTTATMPAPLMFL